MTWEFATPGSPPEPGTKVEFAIRNSRKVVEVDTWCGEKGFAVSGYEWKDVYIYRVLEKGLYCG